MLAIFLAGTLAYFLVYPGNKSQIYQSFKLDNGLEVILVPNHTVPIVTQMIWYRYGSANEPHSKSGIAHFLEHMMFKGTDKFSSGAFSKKVAQKGGKDNAFTSRDFTAYHQTISKENLEMVMEMEADRMRNLKFTQEQFDTEKKVILEERSSRVDEVPAAILSEKMMKELFDGHPYGIPVIGKREEIEALERDDAFNVYNQAYSPNNAILILAGDITRKEAEPLVKKYYGSIPSREVSIDKISTNLPENNIQKRVAYADIKVKTPEQLIYFMAPNHHTRMSELTYPTILLAHILGSGDTSILYQNLVTDKKIAAFASADYDDFAIGPSVLIIHGIPSHGNKIEVLEKAILDEILKLTEQEIDSETIARAKNELIASAIFARDGVEPMANLFGRIVASNIDEDYLDKWDENINKVTASDIKEAANFIFNNMPVVIGALEVKDNKQ